MRYYTSRNEEDIYELAFELNTMIIESKPKKLKTVSCFLFVLLVVKNLPYFVTVLQPLLCTARFGNLRSANLSIQIAIVETENVLFFFV